MSERLGITLVFVIGAAYLAARAAQFEVLATLVFVLMILVLIWRERRASAAASAQSLVAEERRQALMELEEANRLLLLTEEIAHIGHWEVDLITETLFWSDETCRIHGVGAGCSPSLDNAINFYHPDDRQLVLDKVGEAISTRQGYTFEARLVRHDGAVRDVQSVARVECDDQGKAVSIFGVFRDRTDELRRERELRDALDRSREAALAKTRFLANMSHEIRTPMNGVIGFTDLLLADELTETQGKYVQLISDSGHSMLQLLGDILDISKIEVGSMELADESVNVRAKLEHCAQIMAASALAKGILVEVEVEDEVPQWIGGDQLRFRQVFLNLLGNAIKFTETGTIRIHASMTQSEAEPELLVEVADTGIGIDADNLSTIFESFGQADATTARKHGGSGLGLSISRNLARLMGGDITATSQPGEGSTFRVRLPVREAEPLAQIESFEPEADNDLRPARVLIVEDNHVNQMLSQAMCDELGLEHELAINGREAIDKVDAAERDGRLHDLVLMDLQMPEMDGVEATRRLRQSGFDAQRLPIVALTANAYKDDIENCLAAGMQAHLAKPITLAQVEQTIARFVDKSDNARMLRAG